MDRTWSDHTRADPAGKEANALPGPGLGFWLGLFSIALAWRLWVSWLTPLPSQDGVGYLWMAERFAAGDAAGAMAQVFPPLLGLLGAVPVAFGADPFRSTQVILAVAGALAVVFLARGADVVVPGFGRCAGCFGVFAHLPVRFGGEVYSEPLFLLFGAAAVEFGLRRRPLVLGCLAALAFGVRSLEAVVLVLAFTAVAPRRMWTAWLPLGACAAAISVWRVQLGLDPNPMPKAAFNLERSMGASPDLLGDLLRMGENAVRMPWLWLEAFGLLGLLAIWGLLRGSRRGMLPLYCAVALGVLLIIGFMPRRRFLISWLIVVSPIALAGFRALPDAWRRPVFWLVIISGVVLSHRVAPDNRRAERAVGEYLAAQLEPGDRVAGDMTRVIYFAGLAPLPPRPFSSAELIDRARRSGVRFVVLGARREGTPAVVRGLRPEFSELALPDELARGANDRGILVLERR